MTLERASFHWSLHNNNYMIFLAVREYDEEVHDEVIYRLHSFDCRQWTNRSFSHSTPPQDITPEDVPTIAERLSAWMVNKTDVTLTVGTLEDDMDANAIRIMETNHPEYNLTIFCRDLASQIDAKPPIPDDGTYYSPDYFSS